MKTNEGTAMNDTNSMLQDIKLRLNIDRPDIEDCYAFGYECSLNELSESDNPFVEGSVEHYHWQEGWWDAFYGDKPLFNMTVEEAPSFQLHQAANDNSYHSTPDSLWGKWLKITGGARCFCRSGLSSRRFGRLIV